MTLESMTILRVLTDVWLPDFKFGPGRCAMTLAKTPWYWETVTRNIELLDEWGEDFSIRHLVMPNHIECCTGPVLEWIAERVPAAPVNVMAQFHPDNFCDPASAKYRGKILHGAKPADLRVKQPTRLKTQSRHWSPPLNSRRKLPSDSTLNDDHCGLLVRGAPASRRYARLARRWECLPQALLHIHRPVARNAGRQPACRARALAYAAADGQSR
jgi:hypothetical protein